MKTPFLRCWLAAIAIATTSTAPAADRLATEILREMIAYNTAPSGGNDLRPIVAAIQARLREAGFTSDDVTVVNSSEKLPNLVVRLRSPSPARKPMLMMAHLDVVEALPSDWTVDPFLLIERDGYFYGRGTTDNKAGAAMLVANLVRLKREAYRPDRDLIVMLTADEETTGHGALLLANEHRELIDASFALNTDGGLVIERDGKPQAFVMQTGEKVYATYRFEALDPGGHSSVPRADSAISRLARTLVALQAHRFDIDFNDTTRTFFERSLPTLSQDEAELIGSILAGERGASITAQLDGYPYFNSMLRTTCIATLVAGGHAENAIPQRATADVNCRMLPQEKEASIREALRALASPNDVTVELVTPVRPSPPSPLTPAVVEPVATVAAAFWPGIAVIPEMSTGATDGLFIRNVGIPVYAVSAIAEDPADIRAHGQDERIRVESFERATAYWYRLIKVLSRGGDD